MASVRAALTAAGSKQNDIKVVYTPWSNLKKTAGMEVGAIGFHDQKLRRYCKVYKKDNMIVNRLNKTKREEHPNLAGTRMRTHTTPLMAQSYSASALRRLTRRSATQNERPSRRHALVRRKDGGWTCNGAIRTASLTTTRPCPTRIWMPTTRMTLCNTFVHANTV